jgi:hypothetical protein
MISDSNKTGSRKPTTAASAGTKAPDVKTSAPAKTVGGPAAQSVGQPAAPQPEIKAPGAEHHALLAAMRTRWANFADSDLNSVKTREDLSAAVQSKYGITADQATTQVKEWAVGRQF